MSNTTVTIIAAFGGALLGVLTTVLVSFIAETIGPIAKWKYIEKDRRRWDARMQRLEEWRKMVRDVERHRRLSDKLQNEKLKKSPEVEGDPDREKIERLKNGIDSRYQQAEAVTHALKSDERFYSLRNRLSEETIHMIEPDRQTAYSYDVGPHPILKAILRDIDRIEKDWGLLD
jgi:hypothetical protein